jgi:hypothetical protein
MKVFISWSGHRSLHVAKFFHGWIKQIIPTVKPWISIEDIDKGERWQSKLSLELQEPHFGIPIVTPEGRNSAWFNYEIGALSKFVDKVKIAPILVDIKPTEVVGPLAMFQFTKTNKTDMRRLVNSINKSLPPETRIENDVVIRGFNKYWDEFEDNQSKLQDQPEPAQTELRPDRELMEEILSVMKSQRKPTELSRMISKLKSIDSNTREILDLNNYLDNTNIPVHLRINLFDWLNKNWGLLPDEIVKKLKNKIKELDPDRLDVFISRFLDIVIDNQKKNPEDWIKDFMKKLEIEISG